MSHDIWHCPVEKLNCADRQTKWHNDRLQNSVTVPMSCQIVFNDDQVGFAATTNVARQHIATTIKPVTLHYVVIDLTFTL